MMLNKEYRRLWCHGPKPEFEKDDDWADQWYISARSIVCLRPAVDAVVLPGGNRQTREFAEFCQATLGLNPDQFFWTSGNDYLLDDGIRKELLPDIRRRISSGTGWTLVPYSFTHPFGEWVEEFSETVTFGDPERWVARYGTKAILHPNAIPDRRKGSPLLGDHVPGIVLPRGYACGDSEELRVAFNRLKSEGCEAVILKPAVGAAGEGMRVANNWSELGGYDFPMGEGVLEECVAIDRNGDDRIIAPSVQYNGSQILGLTDQEIHGTAYAGNVVPAGVSSEFEREAIGMVERILIWLKPQGPGGFDFLSVGGRPVLIDPNLGRFTGAHPARFFTELHAPGSAFACWKVEPPANQSVWDLWDRLSEHKLAFDFTSQTGVFPMCWLPGMWGMLIAIGRIRKEVLRLRAESNNCLS